MGINISQIKNQNLKELASLVDNSFDGKTRGNGMIDDCELSVFIDKAKKSRMGAECAQVLGLSNVTQQKNTNKQNLQTKKTVIFMPVIRQRNGYTANVTYFNGQKWVWTRKCYEKSELNFINVLSGIRKALKQPNSKGIISKKVALKILQNLFEKGSDEYSSGEYSGKGGQLSAIKDLFELYMDKDSDGGENITQQEQFAIMRTIDNWG